MSKAVTVSAVISQIKSNDYVADVLDEATRQIADAGGVLRRMTNIRTRDALQAAEEEDKDAAAFLLRMTSGNLLVNKTAAIRRARDAAADMVRKLDAMIATAEAHDE